MNIEIAEPGRMSQSGSSLLKLLQNNSMPVLDLLVRESIQNSLDAGIKGTNYVEVDFQTGTFIPAELNRLLDGVSDSLNLRYPGRTASFLSIRDINTCGLTGPLHYSEVTDSDYGNLIKLVYEISKEQESSGAGGSWGLGKTIYYRTGMGLVLYYSRIRKEDGTSESRLAACMVEDEKNRENRIIPPFIKEGKKSFRGIAWWGQKYRKDNQTIPVTDDEEIRKILQVFGIAPYRSFETGTTIIIPYIDENRLLSNNAIKYESVRPFWTGDLSQYLKVAVQRWYAPRLDNRLYQYGPYLKCSVNSQEITSDRMAPSFRLIQDLYNYAFTEKDQDHGSLRNSDITVYRAPIKINKTFNIDSKNSPGNSYSSEAGTLVYTVVDSIQMGMVPPENHLSPYISYGLEEPDSDTNPAVILFTRKPGMIVSYRDNGMWTGSIPERKNNEFLIGFFILNSENRLSEHYNYLSLEEYIRTGERADHNDWFDQTIQDQNPQIVSKIQKQVVKKVIDNLRKPSEDEDGDLSVGIGSRLGKLLLPPKGFGKQPAGGGNSGSSGNGTQRSVAPSFVLNYQNLRYLNDKIIFSAKIDSGRPLHELAFSADVETQNGYISLNMYEKLFDGTAPIMLSEVTGHFLKIGKKKDNSSFYLGKDRKPVVLRSSDLMLSFDFSDSGTPVGFSVSSITDENHSYLMYIELTFLITKRNFLPVFKLEKRN